VRFQRDVILFIGQLEGGGAEKHCFELAAALGALGIGVIVVGTQARPETLSKYAAVGTAVILVGRQPTSEHQLSVTSIGRVRRFAGRWNQFRLELAHRRPVLLHAFLPYANLIALSVRPFVEIPVMVAGHRYAGRAGFVYNLTQAAEVVFCRLCELNLANSRDVAEFLRKDLHLPAARIGIAVNGISFEEAQLCRGQRADVRRELGIQEDEIAVGMVCNLWPYKGIGEFQKAVARVRKEGLLPVRAFVAGRDVGTLAGFEAQNRRLGIADHFRFLGGRSDVCRLLRGFDLYVSASRGEGMSNSVLEAMAHGLAIVGSRAAGTPEMLDDGRAGRLFDAGDWETLAGHLSELILSPTERSRLARIAEDRVRTVFTLERMVSETLRAYSEASRAFPEQSEYFARKAREAAAGWRSRDEDHAAPTRDA
jgi:glycosyltransferase involved in cell wall biosynthesis